MGSVRLAGRQGLVGCALPRAEGNHGWVYRGRDRMGFTPAGTMEADGVRLPCDDTLSGFPKFISLTRPLDSHLEHVDFSSLLRCLSFEQILQLFASAVLERRIIFLADGLRFVQPLSGSAQRTGVLGFRGTAGGPPEEVRLWARVPALLPPGPDQH